MLLITIFWFILAGSERSRSSFHVPSLWVNRILLLSLFFACYLSFNPLFSLWVWHLSPSYSLPLFNNFFHFSPLSALFSFFSYLLALVLIRPTFCLPKLLSLFGLILLLFVNNYISFFLSLECQSLLLYLLASRDSISSGLKYFIIGSFSSSLILFGISLLYLSSGFTDISLIHDLLFLSPLPTSSSLLFGHHLILLGLFIKLGVPPFHLWNVDLLDTSRSDLTSWFGTLSKLSLFYLLPFLSPSFSSLDSLTLTTFLVQPFAVNLSLFIFFSFFLGSFFGLLQTKLKRLFAYSSVFHLGFILLSFSGLLFPLSSSLLSSLSFLFYILQYFLSFFILLLLVQHSNALYLHDVKLNIFSLFFFVLHLLSLAGFPPFSGFVAKFFILSSVISHSFFLCLIALLASVFSFFLYFNLIRLLSLSPSHSISNSPDSFLISFPSLLSLASLFSFFVQ